MRISGKGLKVGVPSEPPVRRATGASPARNALDAKESALGLGRCIVYRKKLHHLARFGVAAKFGLLEDRGAVAGDFKASPAGWRQCDDRLWKRRTNLGRQTGGPWLVVSKRTVFNADLHGFRSVVLVPCPPAPWFERGSAPRESLPFARCQEQGLEQLEWRSLNRKCKRSQPPLGSLASHSADARLSGRTTRTTRTTNATHTTRTRSPTAEPAPPRGWPTSEVPSPGARERT